MNRYKRALLCCATMASLLLAGWDVAAVEVGDFCWNTESGKLLRFSVSEAGTGHYTYTGMFTDTDGADLAIIGHVRVEGGALIGSFSGSKTTPSVFKTFIHSVTFNPSTFVGTSEGIRHSYDRSTTIVSTEYRTHTLTPTSCP